MVHRIQAGIIFLLCCGSLFLAAQKTPRAGSKPVEKNGVPWLVAVVRNDVKVVRSQVLEIWSSYYVYAEDAKKGCYLGIHEDASDLKMMEGLGWVNMDFLLTSCEALRTDKKIFRKVIISEARQDQRVPIYAAPIPEAKELGKVPMYAFFYIYKETQDYFLIGLNSTTGIEEAGNDLLGWIDKKTCREWNTRQAVSYRDDTREARLAQENGTGMVCIYKTQPDAEKQNTEGVLDRESPETSWYYNTPRYPLLASETVGQKRLFQIAFLGGKKSSTTPHFVAKLRESRQKLAQVDVMFVVDSTMADKKFRPFFVSAVNNAVTEFRKQAANQKGLRPDLAFGITFYNDFTPQTPRYKRGKLFEPRVVHVHPMETNLSQFERTIENEYLWPPDKKPVRKSLFYAIDSAMHEKAKWRAGSQRYIIVIGLTGNHQEGANSECDISRLTAREICEALKENEIALYGIQFLDDADERPDAVLCFREQILNIVKDTGQGGYISLFKKPPEVEGKKDLDLPTFLSLLFEHNRQEYKLVQTTLAYLEYGFTPAEAINRHQAEWKELWEKFQKSLKERGITAEMRNREIMIPDLEKITAEFITDLGLKVEDVIAEGTFFDKGWVWEFQPDTNIQQIQVWLLIDKLELSRLSYFLASLHSELKNASKPEQYLEVWKTLLRTTFGIDTIPMSEPIDNLIQQRTGLPFINGLLSYSLDDFVKKSQSANFRQTVLHDLDRTCNRLFEILNEQEPETITYSDGTAVLKQKKRWWQEKGSDVEYAWIEVEMFP